MVAWRHDDGGGWGRHGTVTVHMQLVNKKKKEKSRFDDYYEEFNDLWATAKPYELPK